MNGAVLASYSFGKAPIIILLLQTEKTVVPFSIPSCGRFLVIREDWGSIPELELNCLVETIVAHDPFVTIFQGRQSEIIDNACDRELQGAKKFAHTMRLGAGGGELADSLELFINSSDGLALMKTPSASVPLPGVVLLADADADETVIQVVKERIRRAANIFSDPFDYGN